MKNKLLIGLFGISLVIVMGFASNNSDVHYAMNKGDFVAAVVGENP